MSATYALAVGRVAPVKIPAKIRLDSNKMYSSTIPKYAKEIEDPIKPINITGLLPILSDKRPQIGDEIN